MSATTRRRLFTHTVWPAVAATLARPALAQSVPDVPLSLYMSLPNDDMAALSAAFQVHSPQRLNVWRASSEQILQRVLAETAASRQGFDVVETNTLTLEPLRHAGALRSLRELPGANPVSTFTPPHGQWTAERLSVLSCAWNTQRVASDEVPMSYDDLLHPRWMGRIALEVDDYAWAAALHASMGGARARRWFEQLAALKPQMRKGHSLIANLVAAGEVPLSLSVYSSRAAQLQAGGAPIRHKLLAPSLANVIAMGVGRDSKQAAAAARWINFVHGPGQELLRKRHHVTPDQVLRGDACCAAKEGFALVDPVLVGGEAGKRWRAEYQQFMRRAAG